MAINKRILNKISEKLKSDIEMQENIKKVLTGVEEGRQAKRIITKMMKTI